MGLGKAWSACDDERLCHAWIHVSEDPVRGTGQKTEAFWARVGEQFHKDQSEETQRTIRSIMARWGTIQAAVSKFCEIWAQISASYENGTSHGDQIRSALETYQQTHVRKLSFEFLRCWYVLRDSPKWNEICEKDTPSKRKARRIADEISQTKVDSQVDNENPTLQRPVGSKKAKAERSELRLLEIQANATKEMAEASKKKEQAELLLLEIQANAAKDMAEASKKKVQTMQDQVQINLFAMRDDQIPESSRRFFELKRASILRELEAEHIQAIQATQGILEEIRTDLPE